MSTDGFSSCGKTGGSDLFSPLFPQALRGARYNRREMEPVAAAFARLSREVDTSERISYPLAELNDLLTAAPGDEIVNLPAPSIADSYRLNYVTAMVELAAHKAGVAPPLWTLGVPPLDAPVFIDPSLRLRAHLLTASPVPFRRRNIFIDSSIGDRV
jgi:hypothetical protein